MRWALGLLLVAAFGLLSSSVLASQVWTVGPGVGMDFPTPAAALASPSVQSGHVLSVAGGSYPAFTVDKAVHIVGSAPVWVEGTLTVQGVEAVTLVGIRPRFLELIDISGPARLREIHVGGLWGSQWTWHGGLRVIGCTDVLVEHSTFPGSHGCYPDEVASFGVSVNSSRAVFVDCLLEGGTAFSDWPGVCGFKPTLSGGAGLVVLGSSEVLLASCTVKGGVSGDFYPEPAAGIRIDGPAIVGVRGRSGDQLAGGEYGPGTHAPAVHLTTGATGSRVWVSGVAVTGSLPAAAFTPSPPQPFVRQVLAGPGAATLWLHGESALPALLVAGLPGPALTTDFGALWIDLAGPLAFLWRTLAGHEAGVPLSVAIPADVSLAGLHIQFQALVLELSPGRSELTNPVAISPGF